MTLFILGAAFVAAATGERYVEYFPTALRAPSAVVCPSSNGPRQVSTISDGEAEWYPSHWRAAEEPSLCLASVASNAGSQRALRFTWLRSFHEPVVVRIDEQANGGLRLTAKRLSGKGGYSPGQVIAQIDRELTHGEASEFRRTVASAAAFEVPPVQCHTGTDGARWILEANDRGTYRYMNQWSPDDGPIREVGMLLLSYTGWRLDPVY